MPVVAAVLLMAVELLELVAQAAVETLALAHQVLVMWAQMEQQILVVVVAVVMKQLRLLQEQTAAQVVQVSSSSRPINNEDKWKLKSIGCMESTPQCTC
jgi:hypothetical protein